MTLNTATLNTTTLNTLGTSSSSGGVSILDSIVVSSSASIPVLEAIINQVKMLDSVSSSVNYSITVQELFSVSSKEVISFLKTILDSIVLSEAIEPVPVIVKEIIESLRLLSEEKSYSSFINNLIDITNILDSVEASLLKEISETVSIQENLSFSIDFLSKLIEQIAISDQSVSSNLFISVISDNLSLLEDLSQTSIYQQILNNNIIVSVDDGSLEEPEYISYVMSPETFSVSTYLGYNFIGSCKYNDSYLFISNTGLYRYGSSLDDEEMIQAEIETAALSFGTSNLKSIPNFYMGLSNSNKLVLKVRTDGTSEVHYKLNKKTDSLQTQKISIGKGLIGRYFQFEIITQDNTSFELEDIEFTPLILKRKI